MLGAGIYGLVGKAAGVAGGALWLAFLTASAAALLTGLSYASIASRYPRAGGAAYVTGRAYRRPWLAHAVGLTVVCSGLLSIATQSKVVAQNLGQLLGTAFPGGEALLAAGFVLVLAGIVFRGVSESFWVNAVCTVLEAGGLLLVVVAGARFWGDADLLELPDATSLTSGAGALLLVQGAILTFFSFIGFEDILNVGEEAKNPQRTMPLALIAAMLVAMAVYLAVSVTAVSVVPWRELSAAPAPLRLVIERAAPWFPAIGFTAITIASVANTALVNYVMASRMIYGMARQDLLPGALGRVHAGRRTPHLAILAILGAVVALQLVGDIEQLAGATVLLLLAVFAVVNGALILLKRREGPKPGCFDVPVAVPAGGVLVCGAMIAAQAMRDDPTAPALAAGLIGAILLLRVPLGRAGVSPQQRRRA